MNTLTEIKNTKTGTIGILQEKYTTRSGKDVYEVLPITASYNGKNAHWAAKNCEVVN